MMKKKRLIIKNICLLLSVLLLTSCQAFNSTCRNKPYVSQLAVLKTEIASFNLSNPEEDVERNYANNDKRFIAVVGIAAYCPGLTKDETSLLNKYGIRTIDGTSDMIESEEHGQLQAKATRYAEHYNKALLEKLYRYEID